MQSSSNCSIKERTRAKKMFEGFGTIKIYVQITTICFNVFVIKCGTDNIRRKAHLIKMNDFNSALKEIDVYLWENFLWMMILLLFYDRKWILGFKSSIKWQFLRQNIEK